MLRHNLLLLFRQFSRQKSTFFINLIGLSAGLACVLLIYLWVADEWRMDKFHAREGRLIQVMANHKDSEQIRTLQETPDLLAAALAAEMPEVELATSFLTADMIPEFTLAAQAADERVKAAGQFADRQFFSVFSYPLMQGDVAHLMDDPNAIVLSEKLATTLFKSPENALGQSVNWRLAHFERTVKVTGVFKNLPKASSNQFDFVLTEAAFRDPSLFKRPINWDNHAPKTVVVLKKGVDEKAFEQKIAGFIKAKDANSGVSLFTRPWSAGWLFGSYENGVQAGGRISYVKLFGLIALFILAIACINFMNLSTARASLRMKEVGIKKAVGISRKSLVMQFMGESMMMSLLALVVATGLVFLLLPSFNLLTDKTLDLISNAGWVLPFLTISLISGLISGSYPAFYLSGFQPVAMLKGRSPSPRSELLVRKGLVVFQFALSVAFMVGVAVVYRQIQLVQTKDMGFNREQVIQFSREGRLTDGLDAFLAEVKKLPGVVEASSIGGDFIGDLTSFTTGINWPGKTDDETLTFSNLTVNFDFLETLEIGLAEGRSFSRKFGADSTAILFNKTAVHAMGLKNPIGQTVQLWGKPHQIIGVAKDFHLKSLREPIGPAFFHLDLSRQVMVMVRLQQGREREAIGEIERFYNRFNPGSPFDFKFLNDDFQKMYATETRISALSRWFAGLAILLSCLGLFGLAAFTAEQRTKEIGVRKVLGASVASVVGLLSKDFLKLVVVAIFIASPVAYFFMEKWLGDFAFRVEIGWWVFAAAGLAAVAIAFLTVSFQSIKAALANPVKSLRSE